MVQENLRLLGLPENQALLRDSHRYYPSLQPPKDAQFFWNLINADQQVETTEEESQNYEDRFVQLYNKFYSQVLREADVIITTCHQAGAEVLIENYRPTEAIVDQCNLATGPEALFPLVMYKDVRFRILLGNIKELRPHTLPANDPFRDQIQLSLLKRWALTEVPVFELTAQYSQKLPVQEGPMDEGPRKSAEDPKDNDASGNIPGKDPINVDAPDKGKVDDGGFQTGETELTKLENGVKKVSLGKLEEAKY